MQFSNCFGENLLLPDVACNLVFYRELLVALYYVLTFILCQREQENLFSLTVVICGLLTSLNKLPFIVLIVEPIKELLIGWNSVLTIGDQDGHLDVDFLDISGSASVKLMSSTAIKRSTTS